MSYDKKALLVGIDNYGSSSMNLKGCVSDVHRLGPLLKQNDDTSPNYLVQSLEGSVDSNSGKVTRQKLREKIVWLFENAACKDILFYFAGHGAETPFGAELVTSDWEANPVGVSMNDVLVMANGCGARQVTIILDCCKAGALGDVESLQSGWIDARVRPNRALIGEGVQVLSATRSNQSAAESDGRGMFTDILIDGLQGAAADLLGVVTLPSLFVYASSAFDVSQQSPVFKTYSSHPSALRRCRPRVDHATLRRLTDHFEQAGSPVRLGPDCDVPMNQLDSENLPPRQRLYRDLMGYRDEGLLRLPPGHTLYHCVENSLEVLLSTLGQHYWRLAKRQLL